MIKIEITDPHLMPQAALIELAAYLMKVAGAELRKRPVDPIPAPSEPIVVTKQYVDNLIAAAPEPIPVVAEQKISEDEIDAPLPPLDAVEPTTGDDDVDISGIRWDARIHTRTRSKTFDGRWKIQRGIPQSVIDTVLGSSTQDAPVMVTPPDDPIADEIDYPELMRKITQAVGAGKLTHVQIANILKEVGAPPLPTLGARPDLIPRIAAIIDNFI